MRIAATVPVPDRRGAGVAMASQQRRIGVLIGVLIGVIDTDVAFLPAIGEVSFP
jgi:hypothetical protein